MKRVWVVDDKIPLHELYDAPFPTRLDARLVRHLVENLPPKAWDEPEVLELCRALCEPEFDATFFLSPENMLVSLHQGAIPPHAVIFDWEYPGANAESNCAALAKLLGTSFAYVQVYTHLGHEAVEPMLSELRTKYGDRLLPARTKASVAPAQLACEIREAWTGTIAGEFADEVRSAAFAAVERSLIDMCGVPRGVIASMTEGRAENLVQVILSKVRDEIGVGAAGVLEELVAAAHATESSDALRQLMSVWYYFFPSDNRVRRGDVVDVEGGLGLVVTPACDLVKFPKKAGRRLTWLRCVRLDQAGLRTLRTAGHKFNDVGKSIIAAHGEAGDAIIVLPNVPLAHGDRKALEDLAVVCHAWESRVFEKALGGPLTYDRLDGLQRRCTLADPFANAVVGRVTAVMSSPGTPDFPKGELTRLQRAVSSTPPESDTKEGG